MFCKSISSCISGPQLQSLTATNLAANSESAMTIFTCASILAKFLRNASTRTSLTPMNRTRPLVETLLQEIGESLGKLTPSILSNTHVFYTIVVLAGTTIRSTEMTSTYSEEIFSTLFAIWKRTNMINTEVGLSYNFILTLLTLMTITEGIICLGLTANMSTRVSKVDFVGLTPNESRTLGTFVVNTIKTLCQCRRHCLMFAISSTIFDRHPFYCFDLGQAK